MWPSGQVWPIAQCTYLTMYSVIDSVSLASDWWEAVNGGRQWYPSEVALNSLTTQAQKELLEHHHTLTRLRPRHLQGLGLGGAVVSHTGDQGTD